MFTGMFNVNIGKANIHSFFHSVYSMFTALSLSGARETMPSVIGVPPLMELIA